mgnify:CR=1 FL=1
MGSEMCIRDRSIIAIVNRYDALHSMIIILSVLVGFYIAGLIIRMLAEKYLIIEEEKELTEETQENTDESEENAAKEEVKTSEDEREKLE